MSVEAGRESGIRNVSPEVIADLRQRFGGFPVPDGPFDPSSARPHLLRNFGLPPKPNADRQQLLRRAWDRGFGKPMILQRFAFTPTLIELVRTTEYRPALRARQESTALSERLPGRIV
nr:hypothetical protein [uncultured Rhodopila sp.]